jgi:hypothetical protein
MLIGQSRFDASQSAAWKYALRHKDAKTIIVEFAPDGNGAASGTVALYLGEQSGAPPYFTTSAKTLRFYPSPDCEYVTLVPSKGAEGLVTVSISQRELGIGICPFESGGDSGALPKIVQTSTLGRNNGANMVNVFAAPPTKDNLLVLISSGGASTSLTLPPGFIPNVVVPVGALEAHEGGIIAFKTATATDPMIYQTSGANDWTNVAIYEVANAGLVFANIIAGANISANLYGGVVQMLNGALCLAAIQQGYVVPWSDVAPGFTSDFPAPTDAGNHWATYLSGSASGTSFVPIYADFSAALSWPQFSYVAIQPA